MTKYERHPAPDKMLLQITTEAVNLLALGGADDMQTAALPETGAGLIIKAWGLPQELHQASVDLIQREKELVRTGSHEAALPDDQLLEAYDGRMTAELMWGLFETAIRLEDPEDRKTIHQLALLLADILNFDEWIESCGTEGKKN